MSRRNLDRFIKLTVIAAVAVILSVIRVRVWASQTQEPTNIVPFGASIAEKLGTDDGSALIVHFSGDIHGNLDVCSCKGRLLGGMARRVSFSKLFKEAYKKVPVLLVDTGGFLMDRTGEHGFLRNFSTVRDRWTIQGYEKYGYLVANISEHELPYLTSLTLAGEKLPEYPGRDALTLISANLLAKESAHRIRPYLIVNATAYSDPGEAKPIKVAFVGLSDSPESVEGSDTRPPVFRVTDPVEAAKKYVSEARSKADIVIVLAHLPTAKAIEVARGVPGIDVLISGNEEEFTRPLRIDKTLVLFTSYETHSIGEVRFYRSPEGGAFTSKDRYISLDSAIADDPDTTKFVNDMVAEVKESTKKFSSGAANPGAVSSSSPGGAASRFAGAAECSKCHLAQYMTWTNSPHAHATTSLAPKTDELESGCFVCHTTGFGKGGFTEGGPVMKYSNVQCEQCHGPALEHIAKPDKSYGKITNLAVVCNTCHTSQTSPKFDPKAAWEVIKH